MPLFEYKCRSCGASFEKLIPAVRRDDVACPDCGAERSERQLSTFAASVSGGNSAPPCATPSCVAPGGGFT